ncbi:hypothetical protein [Parvibaculum sp.]|uniref:hypothetical protein n=1 Tax=Parvibaculum sp. TaxID=2024848 RepID=UPI00260F9027|nr:hypothetical protein [uncultured Parasphingopyxis sp.]
MARLGPKRPMSLVQATITFVIAFIAVNVVIDVMLGNDIYWARHIAFSLIAAPIWYFFVKWMRSRRA